MKFDIKKVVKEIPMVVLGNACIAAVITFFVIPNQILVGGSAGVGVILHKMFGIDESIVIQIITIGMFLIGVVVLGGGFAGKTIISAVALPLLLSLFTFIYNNIDASLFKVDTFIATIVSGIMIGLGLGLVYRHDASTGGMDIPPLIIHKMTGIAPAKSLLVIDGLTVLFGAVTSGLQAALYGVVSVWICSYMINKTMTLGSKEAKQVTIISEKLIEIQEAITRELDMGCTLLQGKGGHTNQEKMVVLTIIHQKQMPALMKVIDRIDAKAFVIVADTNEVRGRGFTLDQGLL